MTLSLDIGASKIRIAEVVKGEVRDRKEIETPGKKKEIKEALFNLIESYNKPRAIGIGAAAFTKNGRIYKTPNMDFNNVDLKSMLEKKFSVPVFVDNDANCAGLAEAKYGHGKGKKNFILLTLGTGIGGAVILDGKLYHGNGFAGEPGQTLLERNRLESIASGPASVRLAKKYGLDVGSFELEKLADSGNKKALKVYREIGDYLGRSILNFSYILDPEVVILGGGFAKVKHLYPPMKEAIEKNDLVPRKIKIKHAKLSDDAGLIGASLLPRKGR